MFYYVHLSDINNIQDFSYTKLVDQIIKRIKLPSLEPKISGMNVEFNYSSEFYDKY